MMKKFKLLPVLATLFAMLFLAVPLPAYAARQDEAHMQTVADQIDGLWTFVDTSLNVTDERFYAQFIKRAHTAQVVITQAYNDLGKTAETKDTKTSIEGVRADIKTMLSELSAWQTAAKQADAKAFQSASDSLEATVITYNQDVVIYDNAAYGRGAAIQVAFYAGLMSLVFMACALLFAWAFYRNSSPLQDIVQEINRRLRWRAAYVAVIILIGTAVPSYIFFFTDSTPAWWTWLGEWAGLLLECYVMYHARKARQLARRNGL